MKYRLSLDVEKKLEQFARSNFAELFLEILKDRQDQINKQFRSTLPEMFLQLQGRALEIDDLLTALKLRASGD